jgi:hypothetical protein
MTVMGIAAVRFAAACQQDEGEQASGAGASDFLASLAGIRWRLYRR